MDDIKSKSQKKRDAEALRKMGLKLLELSSEKLEQLPLPINLHQALSEAKAIKSHGAKRRQVQLIGKLMRSADYEAIVAAYDELNAEDSAQTFAFHEAERWRERLLTNEKNALTDFITNYQPADIQELRQLIKKAAGEQEQGQNRGAAKALFRLLRSYIS